MSTETPHSAGPEILPEGYVVAGRYRVLSLLGKGGMGCVYRVADAVLGDEQVAIKILHPDFIHDKELMKRFLREVQLMRRVSHKNVVRTYDVGSDGNLAYFTMEYVPGQSLEPLIQQQAITRDKIANLVVQVADALEAIHKAGIVHRDLKPGNILVLDDGTVRITDFGVARPEVSEMTAHNEILGSVCYIAPEIWLGKEPGPSVDLYSLGIILYEIATGNVPFDGGSPAELMRLHLDREPVPPKELNSATPPWLNSVILRLLQKDPAQRFLTAAELSTHVALHLDDGRRRESDTQDASSFLDELEQKSQVLEAITPAVEARLTKEANISEPLEKAPSAHGKRNVRSPRAGGDTVKTRLLQIGRALFFSLVLFAVWYLIGNIASLIFDTGSIAHSLAAALLLIVGISIPCFVMTLSCKAWKLLIKNSLLAAVFGAVCLTFFFATAYFSSPIAEVETSERFSFASARALEQLVSLSSLQAVVALPEDPSSTARVLPVTEVATSIFALFGFLALLGFMLHGVLRQQRRNAGYLPFTVVFILWLGILAESLLFAASPVAQHLSLGVVTTASPLTTLMLGALHWGMVFVVAVVLSTRSKR